MTEQITHTKGTLFEIQMKWISKYYLFAMVGVLVFLLFSQNASAQLANKVVSVTGFGSTVNEARNDAVRQALQETMQQLIVVDRAVKDDQLVRDKILSTMNGYIENFRELSIKKEGQQIAVAAEVTVSPSRIENFIGTSIGGGGSVSGAALFAESQREIAQRKVRGEIFDRLFRGFPSEVIKAKVLKMSPSDDLKSYNVDIEISFSQTWLRALKSGLKALSKDAILDKKMMLDFNFSDGKADQHIILPAGDYGTFILESLRKLEIKVPIDVFGPSVKLLIAIKFLDDKGLSAGVKTCFNAEDGDFWKIKQIFPFQPQLGFIFNLNPSRQPNRWYLDMRNAIQRIVIPADMLNVSAAKKVALLPFIRVPGSPNSRMVTDVLATEPENDICGEPMDRAVQRVMMQ